MGVPVSVILGRKGDEVATITPTATLAEAATALTDRGIGALVVSTNGVAVEGVLSERDIVREMARQGPAVLEEPVSMAMTGDVTTCRRDTSTNELIAIMTEKRIRHVPVLDDDRLAGIVSIGDIVKWRMDELADEGQRLREYVTGSQLLSSE